MPTVAYLANLFPSPFEPYVREEIEELRRRGVRVVPCSVRPQLAPLEGSLRPLASETLYMQPLKLTRLIRAAWFCAGEWARVRDLFRRILLEGDESPAKRVRALLHTWLGAYLALVLRDKNVEHIHVHHGYFGSWVALVAARLLRITFSMTLHGSDLLLHPAYLDTKLEECGQCVTISDFNRQYILKNYPKVDPSRVVVHRMGVDCRGTMVGLQRNRHDDSTLVLLSVGRLHAVKDHKFLLRACRWLKDRGLPFVCWIAGEGNERRSLERSILGLGLSEDVKLLGHVPHQDLGRLYTAADLVVLTSRSEGIPLVLMEAVVHGAIVLAPAITGIPELVVPGETGFLYQPGSLEDFVSQVEWVHQTQSGLDAVRRAAYEHVVTEFNREVNLAAFCDLLVLQLDPARINSSDRSESVGVDVHEDPVLQ